MFIPRAMRYSASLPERFNCAFALVESSVFLKTMDFFGVISRLRLGSETQRTLYFKAVDLRINESGLKILSKLRDLDDRKSQVRLLDMNERLVGLPARHQVPRTEDRR
jgi:hypothetical protein